MPALKTAPSPELFATKWTSGFAAAVRKAGGKDGRISRSEAAKMADLPGALAQYADNAVNYLEKTGQKTVSIEKLIGRGHNYALACAHNVAGNGGRVSLVEARLLPKDLQADFFQLRGKTMPGDATDPGKLSGKALDDAVESALVMTNGGALQYMSESDYDVIYDVVSNPGNANIDGDFVMDKFKSVIDSPEYFGASFRADDVLTTKTDSADETAARLSEWKNPDWDDFDDYYIPTATAFMNLANLLSENLTDIRHVRVGPADDDGSMDYDSGLYADFWLGKDADGRIVGVHYGSVET